MGNPCWHILRVASGSERSVALSLGAPAYLPHRTVQRFNRKHRRKVVSRVPVLPGLLFVKILDPSRVNTTVRGVLGWVRDGSGCHLIASSEDIKYMRRMEMGQWSEQELSEERNPVVGDEVIFVEDTPFEGLQATLINDLAKDRAIFQLIANGLNVEADISHVVAA